MFFPLIETRSWIEVMAEGNASRILLFVLLFLGAILLPRNAVDAQMWHSQNRCRDYHTEDECYAHLECFWFGPYHVPSHHTPYTLPAFCDTWADKY